MDTPNPPINQTTPVPTDQSVQTVPETKPRQNNILLVILVAVVMVAILATLIYFTSLRTKTTQTTKEAVSPTLFASPTKIQEPTLSASDEVDVLEREVNSTDIESVDQELKQIDQESQGL